MIRYIISLFCAVSIIAAVLYPLQQLVTPVDERPAALANWGQRSLLTHTFGGQFVGTPVFTHGGREIVALVKNGPEIALESWSDFYGARSLGSVPAGAKRLHAASESSQIFIYAQTNGDWHSLYFADDGISPRPILQNTFLGHWYFVVSADGVRVLCYPKGKDSVFRRAPGTRKLSEPFVLSFDYAQPRLRHKMSTYLPELSIHPVAFDQAVSLATIDAAQAAALSWVSDQEKTNAYRSKIRIAPPRAAFDVNSDGTSDILVFAPAAHRPIWRSYTLDGYDSATPRTTNITGTVTTWRVGLADGLPVPGDYNGDGMLDLATFAPHTGTESTQPTANWYISLSKHPEARGARFGDAPGANLQMNWGFGDSLAVPGDYDGDGATDIAVYHPSHGTWHVNYSGGNVNAVKAMLRHKGFGYSVQWGTATDVPVGGDFDGDGRSDLAVYQYPATEADRGLWKVHYAPDHEGNQRRDASIAFGKPGDLPLPADYNCDGITDIAVYRAASKEWIVRFGGDTTKTISWGVSGAEPFVGDFDGDGCADPAFFQPGEGFRFEILNSSFTNEGKEVFPIQQYAVTRLRWGSPEEYPTAVLLRQHQHSFRERILAVQGD